MPEKFLVGDKFIDAEHAREIVNPFSNEVVGKVYESNSTHFDKSAAYLQRTFEQYRSTPAYLRAELLSKIAIKVAEHKEHLAKLITDETGKPVKFSFIEIDRAVLTFRLGAEEAIRIHGEALDLSIAKGSEGKLGLVRRFPIGMILGITPWNFPVNLVAHKVSPALASGNVILLKPSSNSMMCGLAIGKIILEACNEIELGYCPINVLTLSGDALEEHLTDPRIKMISFTGSSDVGWGIRNKVVKPRVSLELGGNAGVIITEDADIKSAVAKITVGGFSSAGQSCISVQRVYVHKNIYDEFRAKLVEETKKIKFGNPYEEDTITGPMITEDEAVRAESWVKAAKRAGAEILTGGSRNGAVLEPTVIEKAPDDTNVKCNEVFAPIITIDKYTDFESAVANINNSRFGLQAGVFTNDMKKILYAYNNIQTGGVIINEASAYRMDSMPYGGVKDSGNAREGVSYAIKEMTEERILVI
jgi:acyl-CoA reductase-like NAD-dependent aldehyde dehydrogenase